MKTRMRDGSGHRHYRYLKEDVDRYGNVRIYFRRKGQPKIRLLAKPGTDEFEREYQLAFAGSIAATVTPGAKAAEGTLSWLCQQYFASQTFRALNEATRNDRRRILEAVCAEKSSTGVKVGTFRFAFMQAPQVRKLRDLKAGTPDAATKRVKVIRALFVWACDPENGYATHNPAEKVKALPSRNLDGHKPWTDEDVRKYEERHPLGTQARLALDLLLYTGVRRSDVVKLGPQMERDGKLVFVETKGKAHTRKEHSLPILPPLRRSIDATHIGHLNYLVTVHGKPRTVKGFGNWFKDRCREAELPNDLSAHGVRKLGAQRCAEAGASESQIKALFGWRTSAQAELYTRKANAARLEADAAPLLEGRNENKIGPLSRPMAARGPIRAKK